MKSNLFMYYISLSIIIPSIFCVCDGKVKQKKINWNLFFWWEFTVGDKILRYLTLFDKIFQDSEIVKMMLNEQKNF